MSRKNIHLTDPIEARAAEIIRERGFSGLSDMLATLIREEYERRRPPALKEVPPEYGPVTPSTSEAAAPHHAAKIAVAAAGKISYGAKPQSAPTPKLKAKVKPHPKP